MEAIAKDFMCIPKYIYHMPLVVSPNPSAAFISLSKQMNWWVSVLTGAKKSPENTFRISDPIFTSAQLLT